MSDIPLQSIRRNKTRAGYAPLTDNLEFDNATPSMRATVAAATLTGGGRSGGNGRRNDRYVDDPEEEAGLLEGHGYEEEEEEEEVRRAGSPSRVRQAHFRTGRGELISTLVVCLEQAEHVRQGQITNHTI